MKKIIKITKNKTFNISPEIIKNCIYPSKFCDYTQFNSTRSHPHAGINRGVFKENPSGYITINNTNWDLRPGVKFTDLLEFKALKNHFTGKQNWKKSQFALRNIKFIKKNNKVRGFTNFKNFLIEREKKIDQLFNSILKHGVKPVNTRKNKKLFIDNISVALTKKNNLYFNNRGHHRLAIAKLLNIKVIPIKITITKSEKNLEKFLNKNN